MHASMHQRFRLYVDGAACAQSIKHSLKVRMSFICLAVVVENRATFSMSGKNHQRLASFLGQARMAVRYISHRSTGSKNYHMAWGRREKRHSLEEYCLVAPPIRNGSRLHWVQCEQSCAPNHTASRGKSWGCPVNGRQ